ncbi:disease resistance protein (TIR-NBS-LRR class) [Trifolium pratense]|uniref:Disease resistance protein (TIR-NBS-LRR class) n=1 Tax=Trifolium pratense TaxID=57577 RepID=A0A2K3NSE5_TRIPR|nr:disease resistance protein (TIR-NBS-LRR class) [Trifolium pratense]
MQSSPYKPVLYEFKFIQSIVDEVSRKLNRIPLNVATHPVGLQARVSDVNSLLELECNDVKMIGIYGIGGIGKTTIAKAVYNTIYDQFRYASFLANVRENASHRFGLVKLQERLLFEILGEKGMKLGNVDKGINIIKDRLCRKRVLLVIDNVDDVEQLQALVGGFDWFGPGSRIIITTRDKHLLTAHEIGLTYEVKKLNHIESLQLFSWNAFKRSEPKDTYLDISNRAVCYAEGLPLALTILGSDLCGRSIHQWESALDKYKRTPNRKVQDILRISFDGLEENEKEIFLYIACFFKGEIMEYTSKALRACDLHPVIGIAVLVDKSLINLDEKGVLSMHDLIQDMGKEIVRQESPMDPGKRSRLWHYEDVLQVLSDGTGTDKIQGIMPSLPEKQEVQLKPQDLKKMRNLGMLIIWNAEFFGGQNYANMTSLNLSSCESLLNIPDVSGIPNLEQIILEDCTSLVEIHETLGSLDKLVYLGVERCTELKKLPSVLNLPSLSCIALNGCCQLENFPHLLGKMENLRIIEAEETAIQELPSSLANFSNLEVLVLKCCTNLEEFSKTISLLPNLQLLDISGCPKLQLFHESMESSSDLELPPKPCLDFESSSMQSSHGFPLLETLDLSDCNLSDDDLHILCCFSNLTSLDISRNHFVTLPNCFNKMSSLQELYMANCKNLQQFSGIPPNLEHIDATSCIMLDSQSLNLLLSQGFHKEFKFEVIAPRPRLPMPFNFNYYSEEGSMSFWIGQKFPRIALCFIFELGNKRIGYFACEVEISINGQKALNKEQYFLSVSGDLVWLYHQENLVDLNTYLLHEQNHVEVSCEIVDASKGADVAVSFCGVHEYKEDEEVKIPNLILITSSSPCTNENLDNTQMSKELHENQCHYEENLENDCCTLPENSKLHEISDEHMQLLSASTREEMFEGNDCKVQKNGKTTDILSADTIHQRKEIYSSDMQLYGDRIWDPMLLECQLNCMNEKNKDNILLSHQESKPKVSLSDDNMEAFYSTLHAERYASLGDTSDDSKLVYPKMSEETKKALETLKEVLSEQICHLLEPTSSTSMKTTLEYLCTLIADDDVSMRLKSVILQLLAEFTQWSCDYNDANMKLDFSTTMLSKLQKLEEGVVANKNQFSEFVSIESELTSQLVYLEERMKELEEQISFIKGNISISEVARDSAVRKKKETFDAGRMLKAERDELRKRRLRLRVEQESAKATKGYIEDEWSKIREKFDRILKIFGQR